MCIIFNTGFTVMCIWLSFRVCYIKGNPLAMCMYIFILIFALIHVLFKEEELLP